MSVYEMGYQIWIQDRISRLDNETDLMPGYKRTNIMWGEGMRATVMSGYENGHHI